MKFVVTVMVRDEIDVIAPMIEHHIAQGADLIIATDNGSVDGTADVLQAYADRGVVELHHDPTHRKQQGVLVTNMARRARTEHAADWVLNVDADEFWAPMDKTLTLRSALQKIPLSLNAFQVPVTNLVGPPVLSGSAFEHLLWRDRRSTAQLQELGIYAQPTDNIAHRGESDIVVSQGNHFVSLESNGQPEPAYGLEVLHLPWRSWAQFERKVVNTGLAYEANPDLRPSKNHHGMADYRRWKGDRLLEAYVLRLPLAEEIEEAERAGWLVKDSWLLNHLQDLIDRAERPDLLKAALDTAGTELMDPVAHRHAVDLGRKFMTLERERDTAARLSDDNEKLARRLGQERDKARAERDRLRKRLDQTRAEAEQAAKAAAAAPRGGGARRNAGGDLRRARRVFRRVFRRSYRRLRRRVAALAGDRA